ncbi:MAG TPA: PQQ-dependent sugar dehydrogenase [Vicinamibacteria bacterium]|nr:PQQ-dependent sugar dehydrogenase [Vicinamibacteria bacterium]
MRRAMKGLAGAAATVAMGIGACASGAPAVGPVARLRPPEGAAVTRFAADLPNVRFLRFTPGGDLLATLPRSGRVLRLEPDRDGDGLSDGRHEVLSGLNRPHGLDLHDGWLYVAETDAVGRVRFDPATGRASGPFERVVTGLPGGGNHWTRTLRFGPDGWMYVSVGSTCNVCLEKDRRRAAVVRYRPDGSSEEVFATGLRNSVGFDWRPEDGQIYATDNGRDLLGDDFPPCELNRVVQGGFYGWPIASGDRVPDPDFGKGQEARIATSIPPVHGFRAHNAPLGMTFLRGEGVPAAYRGAALVALHGSWNRTKKDGYKVVSLHWGSDGRIAEKDFLTGFLGATDDDVFGRPVDVAEGPDGSIYVSDDEGGAIYRVEWKAPRPGAASPAAATAGAARPAPTARVAKDVLARGQVLWNGYGCAACHDAKAAAPGMVTKPLAGLAKRYDAAALREYLRTPQPPMPVFDLSDAERADLALFLLAQHP